MLSFIVALAQLEDIPDILALQAQNHVSNLPAEVLANGFVTTQLSEEVLLKMMSHQGIWRVRSSDGVLAGYACANSWEFYGEGHFQNAAKALLPGTIEGKEVRADNSFQYGPVCVAEAFRGQGILQLLVEAVKTHYAAQFEFGITFIDSRNARSLAAHERKMGFQRIAVLPYGDVIYHMLAFPTR